MFNLRDDEKLSVYQCVAPKFAAIRPELLITSVIEKARLRAGEGAEDGVETAPETHVGDMVGFDVLMFLHGCLNPLTTSLVTPDIFGYVLDQFSHVQSEDFIHICVEVLIKYFALCKKQTDFVTLILGN